jgi:hypothetical protein
VVSYLASIVPLQWPHNPFRLGTFRPVAYRAMGRLGSRFSRNVQDNVARVVNGL